MSDETMTPEAAVTYLQATGFPSMSARILRARADDERVPNLGIYYEAPANKIVYDRTEIEAYALRGVGKRWRDLVTAPSPILSRLSPQLLVSIGLWLAVDYTPEKADYDSVGELTSAILAEGSRRDWPEGWWETPSVIPELGDG